MSATAQIQEVEVCTCSNTHLERTGGKHIDGCKEQKVELRNVKYAAFASQETNCFQATIYIDGVKVGSVSNEGHGGPNDYDSRALEERLNKIGATMPKFECYGKMLDVDADILIGDLLDTYLEAKQLKRLCSTKTLFRLKGETYQKGEWRTVKAKFAPPVKDYLVRKYGENLGQILNEGGML